MRRSNICKLKWLHVIATCSGIVGCALAGGQALCQALSESGSFQSCSYDEDAVAADSLLQRAFASQKSATALTGESKSLEELVPVPGDLISASDLSALSDSVSGLVGSAGSAANLDAGVFQAETPEEVFPDAPDPECVLHSTCSVELGRGSRGLCVLPAAGGDAGENYINVTSECWDVCNLTRAPAEYTNGEGLLAQAVAEGVAKSRAGEYGSVKCPGAFTDGNMSTVDTSAPPEPFNASAYARIFPDVPDRSCSLGEPCGTGGIPLVRGLCVISADGPGWAFSNPNECWDVCNTSHSHKAYKTGSRDLDEAIAKTVHTIRRGRHPSVICPKGFKEDAEGSDVTAAEALNTEIFPDTPDKNCIPRSSCTAGGIPALRGVCVVAVSENNTTNAANATNTTKTTNRTECWDVCNREHSPERYTTAGLGNDAIGRVVAGIRADKYPSVRCPPVNATPTQPFNTTFLGCRTCRGVLMPTHTAPMDHRVRLPQ